MDRDEWLLLQGSFEGILILVATEVDDLKSPFPVLVDRFISLFKLLLEGLAPGSPFGRDEDSDHTRILETVVVDFIVVFVAILIETEDFGACRVEPRSATDRLEKNHSYLLG